MLAVTPSTLLKQCKVCRGYFPPFKTTDQTCSEAVCKSEWRRQRDRNKALKLARIAKREYRARTKPLAKLRAEAQREVNRYVLVRDQHLGCISCHMPASYGGQFHAGHYRTTAAAPQLRFDPEQIRKQCAQCNTMKSGNIIEYRKRLVALIGAERVEAIENNNEVRRYTGDELVEIRKDFAARRVAIKAEREQKG